MVIFSVAVIIFALFAAYYYVQAFKYAMNQKAWLAVGIILGPMALPMFNISKTMSVRRAIGFENVYWRV
ncbi:hypothetical protein [Glaciecola sp. KUL10]|uniref:hypothetical protein n=1 Tax=Glaciecola sp. (strain KUL10) TaxID=2161813 RepID=UPI000D786A72|nr:hypothetical protein [Glaciecola sp. KUL10]GBL05829.1 hypothetical protein KUL10_31620 [Glaciecola sp. KUL10]